MKKLTLAAVLLACTALASPASADAVNNLGLITIPDPDVVPQSASAPCIICATNQAHNPTGFGFNNFDSQGNDSTFNLFSTNITGASVALPGGAEDQTNVTPYTAGQLVNFLQSLGASLTFSVAIDINTTGAKSEFLDFFQLIDLGAPGIGDETVLFDRRNVALPGIHNGNGAADYLLTGFDLSGINIGDRLLFRAQWHGAVDGGESFYIVPNVAVVPGPVVGAGIPGLLAALGGMWGLNRYRRRRTA